MVYPEANGLKVKQEEWYTIYFFLLRAEAHEEWAGPSIDLQKADCVYGTGLAWWAVVASMPPWPDIQAVIEVGLNAGQTLFLICQKKTTTPCLFNMQ